MTEMSVQFRGIAGTEAAVGCAGTHTVTVDRPPGKAGGEGLGLNGGQLLALAIGGCFWNDLHYVAHERGIRLRRVEIDVALRFEGAPLLATDAAMTVRLEAEEAGANLESLVARAAEISTVANSLKRGIAATVAG